VRVMLYDTTQTGRENKFLSSFWRLGGAIGHFDKVLGAASVEHAYALLRELPPTPVNQLQFWGHGNNARMYIAGQSLEVRRLNDAVGGLLLPSSVVWFRACDVFQGTAGMDFAQDCTSALGCSVVGHTRIVSLPNPVAQSGGYGLRPGQTPHWSPFDRGGSGFGKKYPNTCLVTRMTPPASWFQEER
jgi:hypothetical protein